jgi:hypothetical protein
VAPQRRTSAAATLCGNVPRRASRLGAGASWPLDLAIGFTTGFAVGLLNRSVDANWFEAVGTWVDAGDVRPHLLPRWQTALGRPCRALGCRDTDQALMSYRNGLDRATMVVEVVGANGRSSD